MEINKIVHSDRSISIILPMFGDLRTYAKDEDDMKVAIDEAIQLFRIASEKFGMGIKKELKMLGWTNKQIKLYENNKIKYGF